MKFLKIGLKRREFYGKICFGVKIYTYMELILECYQIVGISIEVYGSQTKLIFRRNLQWLLFQ